MAAPTAIPHSENSSHHHHHHPATQASPNKNSPPPFSPIYTRTAFSLPGAPIGSPSSNFRNTASGWATAGAGVNGLKSPTAITSHQKVQKDYFPDRDAKEPNDPSMIRRHHRAFSTSSTSDASTASSGSADSMTGPPTPGGAPLGRVPSMPMGSSYESLKGRRESWTAAGGAAGNWPGYGFRSPSADGGNGNSGADNGNGGGMSGLFRKLSIGQGGHSSHQRRMPSVSSGGGSNQATPTPGDSTGQMRGASRSDTDKSAPSGATRGRQSSVSSSSTTKRKPSPHGERLLMGWTHAH